jgi:nucleoside-specific outer membrane channel protein Tsx
MKKLMLAALAAGVVVAASVPVSVERAEAQAIGSVGLIWHAQVVNRCKNRQLTAEEAKRTSFMPITSIARAYRDCNDKKKK